MPSEIEHIAAFRGRYPRHRFIDVLLADLSGIFRGKRVSIDELPSLYAGDFLLPGSMFALDVLGGTVQETQLGFDEGDADRPCRPIDGSLLPVPWRGEEGVGQIQVSMYERAGQPFYGDPRHALARVLERYRDLALTPVVAIELEFYLLDAERTADGRLQPPRTPETRRRDHRTQINSMSDLNEYSRILADIAAACDAQEVPSG